MKLQDYLHYYMGCKMTHKDNLGAAYILHFDVVKDAISHGDMPVLRRLEDMTEEEARDFLKHAIPGAEYITQNDYGVIWQSQGSRSEIFYLFGPPAGFHCLLSKGFDLFGLIDAGLAIDAKTVTG